MLRATGIGENAGRAMGVGRLVSALARPAVMACFMLLLMRGVIYGCAPMASALMAAGLAAGESAAALVLGCLLGMIRIPFAGISLLPAVSCAAVLAAELAFSALPRLKNSAPETRICGIAGFSVLIPALIERSSCIPCEKK